MARVLIATPTNRDDVARGYALSLARLTAHLAGGGIDFDLQTVTGAILHKQRDWLAHLFLADEACSHLLFIDSDMTFPPDLCERYLAFDKDIVGAISPRRELDLDRLRGHLENGRSFEDAAALSYDFIYKPAGPVVDLSKPFMPLEAVGMGFTLIARECFDRIIAHGNAAKYQLRSRAGTAEGRAFFREIGDLTEDHSFCRRARESGSEVWGDPHTVVGHIGTTEHRMPFSHWVVAQHNAKQPQRT